MLVDLVELKRTHIALLAEESSKQQSAGVKMTRISECSISSHNS